VNWYWEYQQPPSNVAPNKDVSLQLW
jgi:hypothetical protein